MLQIRNIPPSSLLLSRGTCEEIPPGRGTRPTTRGQALRDYCKLQAFSKPEPHAAFSNFFAPSGGSKHLIVPPCTRGDLRGVKHYWQTAFNVCALALSCLLLVVLLMGSVPNVHAQVFPTAVKRVADDFVCQCGCNHQLSACGMVNCGSAVPLQEEIQGYLRQGKSHQEIRDIFISKYSNLILSAPTTHGFDLTAWTMPFVMLFLGFVLVYFLIRVWARRKPALAMEGHGAAPAIPDTYQQQIEKELKDFDS